jgi:hypothetical protein
MVACRNVLCAAQVLVLACWMGEQLLRCWCKMVNTAETLSLLVS